MCTPPGPRGAEIAPGRFAPLIALFACVLAPRPAAAQPAYETVVVAPRTTVAPREDDAASASVVTADRTTRSAETVTELVSELPGVAVTRTGGIGALATLSIRGSSANQVAVYLDGVPLDNAVTGGVDLGLLPLTAVDRLEIYRGMSPLSFGASALGGVVSLSSRTPRLSSVAVHSGGGSFGTHQVGGQGALVGARGGVLVAVDHLSSKGNFTFFDDGGSLFDRSDDDPDARRRNNGLQQLSGVVRADVALPGRRRLSPVVHVLSREQGVPGAATAQTIETSVATRRFVGALGYQSHDDLASGRVRAQAWANLGEQRFRDPRAEVSFTPSRTRDRSTAAGATVSASRALTAWSGASVVLDGRHERFQPFDELAATSSGPPGTRTFGAAGIEPRLLVAGGALEIIPSARLEVARDDVAGRDLFGRIVATARPSTYVLPIGRLALLHHAAPWLDLRANAGRFARLPSMLERYGNTGFVIGNPEIQPETGLHADLGGTVTVGRPDAVGVAADVAVFVARTHDLIQFQQTAQRVQRARNIGEARTVGVEASVAMRVHERGRLVAQSTFVDARDVSIVTAGRGRQLPHRPRLHAYARPELNLPLGRGFVLDVYGDADVTGGNYLDPANLERLPARVLFGAGAGVRATAGWHLVASARNLGGADVVDLAGFPLPRRSLFVTLSFSGSAEPAVTPTVQP